MGEYIGKLFDSYDSLTSFIKELQEDCHVQLAVDNSRKIVTQMAKNATHHKLKMAKKELIYTFIRFKCIHGGTFKSRGNGIRKRKKPSIVLNCPFLIEVKLTRNAQNLVITHWIPDHNHEIPMYASPQDVKSNYENDCPNDTLSDDSEVFPLDELETIPLVESKSLPLGDNKTHPFNDNETVLLKDNESLFNILVTNSVSSPTKQEKYETAFSLGHDICNIMSNLGEKDFNDALVELCRLKSELLLKENSVSVVSAINCQSLSVEHQPPSMLENNTNLKDYSNNNNITLFILPNED